MRRGMWRTLPRRVAPIAAPPSGRRRGTATASQRAAMHARKSTIRRGTPHEKGKRLHGVPRPRPVDGEARRPCNIMLRHVCRGARPTMARRSRRNNALYVVQNTSTRRQTIRRTHHAVLHPMLRDTRCAVARCAPDRYALLRLWQECEGDGKVREPQDNVLRHLKGFCQPCFATQYPTDARSRNYKSKEVEFAQRIAARFPQFDWRFDKHVLGCAEPHGPRPDAMPTHCHTRPVTRRTMLTMTSTVTGTARARANAESSWRPCGARERSTSLSFASTRMSTAMRMVFACQAAGGTTRPRARCTSLKSNARSWTHDLRSSSR